MKALKIRNGGWLMIPTVMLSDLGQHYEYDFRIFRRRVYKSSIDKEYEFGVIACLLLFPAWTAWLIMRFCVKITLLLFPWK